MDRGAPAWNAMTTGRREHTSRRAPPASTARIAPLPRDFAAAGGAFPTVWNDTIPARACSFDATIRIWNRPGTLLTCKPADTGASVRTSGRDGGPQTIEKRAPWTFFGHVETHCGIGYRTAGFVGDFRP